ncbi:hypothetical protein [Spiroplasma turonicum]|uniref:MOLPALP family lipoprotein n=1 Tax=Spiroplasma turonicum TaxID=216946 RepID=A0A0K1P5P8_9MOLU|nr:hypothetical protein [Spiroplasma turonicum]AKU79656.1 hypothetical protein STURON_00410 [Spiroplasma turonicum]ALX70676.1 hypothetical protein STURO_v1c04080 [Spiroplasma turonicum]
MKKILTILGSLFIVVSPIGAIVSCSSSNSNSSLFDDSIHSNNGEYLPQSVNNVTEQFNKLNNDKYFTNINIEESNSDLIKNDILNQVADNIKLKSSDFKVTLAQNKNFSLPFVDNLNLGEESITSKNLLQTDGKIDISLYYFDELLSTITVKYASSIFEAYNNVVNIFNFNSLDNLGKNNPKQLDVSLLRIDALGKDVTLGTIYSLLQTIRAVSGLGPIKPLVKDLDNIAKMDLKSLETYDKNNYDNFHNEFENNFRSLITHVSDLLVQFGQKDEFEVPVGDKLVKIKLSEILDVNILEILNIDVNSFSNDMMSIEIGDQLGKNKITIFDILKNVEPMIVYLFNMIFSTKEQTYFTTSHNLLYSFLKFLTADLDENESIAKIFYANFNKETDGLSVRAASTNLDVFFLNALVGYDKNRRYEKGNFYIKVKVVIKIEELGLESWIASIVKSIVGSDILTVLNNEYLGKVLESVQITPSIILQQMITNMYEHKESNGYFDWKQAIIGNPNDNQINFVEDIDANRIVNNIKEIAGNSFVSTIANSLGGTLKDKAIPMINEKVNAIIPSFTMEPIISLLKDGIIKSLGVTDEWLENNEVEIVKASYDFVFRKNNTIDNNKIEWVGRLDSLNISQLINYQSFKIIFRNVQFKITNKLDKKLVTLSRDDISFDIIFSDLDVDKKS